MEPREYAIALQWVRQHCPRLFSCAEAIVLTPAQRFPAGQTGQCSCDNYINISDGIATTGEYVNTLVHELVHAWQNRMGSRLSDLKREEQAYAAGNWAQMDYMRLAAPWK